LRTKRSAIVVDDESPFHSEEEYIKETRLPASMVFTRALSDLSKEDVDIAGGKGASLGELIKAGIPVPPGFVVVADAFEQFLEETSIRSDIDAALHSVNHEEIHTVENASERIQSLITEQRMPKDLQKEILTSFASLKARFVAVRSSATAEDGATSAWAGQLDSFLNTKRDDVLEKVQRCWASLFTPRAIFYRFEKGLHDHHISVAVIVQQMVDAEKAGIAFSVHPVTQAREHCIIEVGLGLGEAVVSGQITPDSYVVEKVNWEIMEKHVAEQTRGIYRKIEGGNEWRELGPLGKAQKLSDEQIVAFAKLLVKIEEHYNFPVDVEFAVKDNKFFVVQSRPITTLS